MFSVDNYGLNARLKDTTLEVDSTGIGVNIDNSSLIVDNSSDSTGIGVAIDNDYIVLEGPSGVHAGNHAIKRDFGLTLGDTYKQKIKDAPVYIPPAKGNIVFLYGTVSKIMNAISGVLSDTVAGTNFENIQDATWVFPFGTSPYNTKPYNTNIYRTALSSALYNIKESFTSQNTLKPYLRFPTTDKTNIETIITDGKFPDKNLIINSNGKSRFQIYVFPIPESEFFTLPFGLFDEYHSFSNTSVTSGWDYYYTDFDGAWYDTDGKVSSALLSSTTWKWDPSTSLSQSMSSGISGMWNNITNFELPSSVWKYQKYTGSYTWRWQDPLARDEYFNPHDVLQSR